MNTYSYTRFLPKEGEGGYNLPKVIDDVEKRIQEAGIKVFSVRGYVDTDMKTIAKEAGIAVGTLYNYYPSKKELFFNILEISWEETFFQLDKIANSQKPLDKKIDLFVDILYKEINKRQGLGFELIRFNNTDPQIKTELDKINQRFEKLILVLIQEADSEEAEHKLLSEEAKLSKLVVLSLLVLNSDCEKEQKKDKEFLAAFVKRILYLD